MARSPGHQKHPNHQVREERVGERVQVRIEGQTVADSSDVIKVVEDGSPVRYYFPRSDVKMALLERTATTSECPFKGTASYFSAKIDGEHLKDVVWTYEQPYDEHAALSERVAFWEEKIPSIEVEPRV